MADFSLDYSNIDETIQKVRADASVIDEVIVKVNRIALDLKTVWEGTDAAEYIQKIIEYNPSIKKLEESYLGAMDVLQSTSTKYQETQSQNTATIQSELY